ncbi:hypothetical protein ABE354_24625 [Brevibacillus laterosporus]|uniref:hypothetical protein n=1 Tax=Brevibacillus laterosporus TaxID=1465 RepID=UPI003D244600
MGTGIFEETSVNELGTMQGGILSPLLANEYLDIFDQWVAYQWIEKPTKYIYTRQSNKLASLRRTKILKNKIRLQQTCIGQISSLGRLVLLRTVSRFLDVTPQKYYLA